MPVRTKLIILLYMCLALNYQATQSNPLEERSARTKNDVYDWIFSLFGDYDGDDSESEEYLICRNCTVIVGQENGNNATTAPPAVTAMPNGGAAPDPTSAAPGPTAPTAAPPTTPVAPPTEAPVEGAG